MRRGISSFIRGIRAIRGSILFLLRGLRASVVSHELSGLAARNDPLNQRARLRAVTPTPWV